MEANPSLGPYIEIVEAFSPGDASNRIHVGLLKDVYQQHNRLGLRSLRGQFYGIVRPGLLLALHCFQGLKRPLMVGSNKDGDENVFVYTWKPDDDFEWHGDAIQGTIIRLRPPQDSVYAVLVREHPLDGQGVSGVITRWNWIRKDDTLEGAPIDWQIRYKQKLWSRGAQ